MIEKPIFNHPQKLNFKKPRAEVKGGLSFPVLPWWKSHVYLAFTPYVCFSIELFIFLMIFYWSPFYCVLLPIWLHQTIAPWFCLMVKLRFEIKCIGILIIHDWWHGECMNLWLPALLFIYIVNHLRPSLLWHENIKSKSLS